MEKISVENFRYCEKGLLKWYKMVETNSPKKEFIK